jgi:hypothetical protein
MINLHKFIVFFLFTFQNLGNPFEFSIAIALIDYLFLQFFVQLRLAIKMNLNKAR